MRRVILTIAMVMALFAATAGAAGATKPPADGADPADGHKITICHATASLSNPYVEITIDVAAWNDPSDPSHHGDHHTSTKGGVTWSDYVLEEGAECSLDQPPPPPTAFCAGVGVDIAVDFSGDKLIFAPGHQTQTVTGLNIPAGSYEVVLGSSDDPHELPQANEQWRALFGGSEYSAYAEDLPDGWLAGVVRDSDGGTVTLSGPVDTIVAEHWSVAQTSHSADSVIPVCVGLTLSDNT